MGLESQPRITIGICASRHFRDTHHFLDELEWLASSARSEILANEAEQRDRRQSAWRPVQGDSLAYRR